MKEIEYLIFHCSQSEFGDVEVIRGWHKQKGWRDIGYNGVITNGYLKTSKEFDEEFDGRFQEGRALDFSSYVETEEIGAQTLGYNSRSIGICLIGDKKFTVKQFQTALSVAKLFKAVNPGIKIKGHKEMSTARGKTCPNFDMDTFRTMVEVSDFTESNIKDALSGYVKES